MREADLFSDFHLLNLRYPMLSEHVFRDVPQDVVESQENLAVHGDAPDVRTETEFGKHLLSDSNKII